MLPFSVLACNLTLHWRMLGYPPPPPKTGSEHTGEA